MTTSYRFPVACAIASLLAGSAHAAVAQPAAFNYQGRLKNGAQPASGPHDFRFRLFDAAVGGAQIGLTVCADNVPVSGGLFTTPIDLGQQFATPDPRFLEIEVRADTGLGCAATTGFVILGPRQLLTAATSSLHAHSSFALDAPDGSPANAVSVDNDGKVGIGTATPTHTVHVASPAPTLALQDTDSTTQQVGYVDYRDSGNVSRGWVGFGSAGDPDFSVINARVSGDIVLNTLGGGNVGIGANSPLAKLDVHGDIRLGPSGQLRAVGGEENLRIIRGTVDFNAATLAGAGFTASAISEGDYLIVFSTPFSAPPTVTATVDDVISSLVSSHYLVAGVFSPNANSVRIRTRHRTAVTTIPTGPFSKRFHFIAVGPR